MAILDAAFSAVRFCSYVVYAAYAVRSALMALLIDSHTLHVEL